MLDEPAIVVRVAVGYVAIVVILYHGSLDIVSRQSKKTARLEKFLGDDDN